MLPQEIIKQKRDGGTLSADAIKQFIQDVTNDKASEGQVAAFCMSVYFNGMSVPERVALTEAMRDSGSVLDWSKENFDGPIVDKHSTGGVGDKISMLLAPAVAACGGYVPMIAGRGLGHTGGTLDKLDSIPGYCTTPSLDLFKETVRSNKCAIIGQTNDMAPADRRIYAVRDVTSTVESIDLITASILSKKLAAGLEYLVMDVKYGSGAFMKNYDDAKALAESIASVAAGAGTPTSAMLTDMNEVLGKTAGNAVEIEECLDILTGKIDDPRQYEITVALCAEMLHLSGITDSFDAADRKIRQAFESGAALEHFMRMVVALGGPADLIENRSKHFKQAPVIKDIIMPETGFVSAIDTYEIGMSIVTMGGGRTKPTDPIDYRVGLTDFVATGDKVGPQENRLCQLHAPSEEVAEMVEKRIISAISVMDKKPEERVLIKETLTRK